MFVGVWYSEVVSGCCWRHRVLWVSAVALLWMLLDVCKDIWLVFV